MQYHKKEYEISFYGKILKSKYNDIIDFYVFACYTKRMKYSNITEKLIVFQNKFYYEESGKIAEPIETQNYQIIQIADSYYLSDFKIGEHKQFCDIEITYVLYNKMLNFSNGVQANLGQNEVYISLLGEMHALQSDEKCRFITIAFNVKKHSPCCVLLEEILKRVKEYNQRKRVLSRLASLATKVISETYKADEQWQLFSLDALLTQILVGLVEQANAVQNDIFEEGKSLIPKILSYLDEHFMEINVLSTLPSVFGYSYNYIYKLFKKYNGETVQSYLQFKRMEYAKKELLKREKIENVATSLGYTNVCNFSRAFKKYVGVAPAFFEKTI